MEQPGSRDFVFQVVRAFYAEEEPDEAQRCLANVEAVYEVLEREHGSSDNERRLGALPDIEGTAFLEAAIVYAAMRFAGALWAGWLGDETKRKIEELEAWLVGRGILDYKTASRVRRIAERLFGVNGQSDS